MATVGSLAGRADLGLRSLTTPPATAPPEIEAALLVDAADLAVWPASDLAALRRLLLVVPLAPDVPVGLVGSAVQRLDGLPAAGVVLAPAGRDVPDLGALAEAGPGDRPPLLLARDTPVRTWARITEVIRERRNQAVARATDEYREMHREATREDGLQRLLRWLSRQVNGSVALLDGAGAARYAHPAVPRDVLERASGEIERVLAGRARAAAADVAAGVAHVQAIRTSGRAGALVVTGGAQFSTAARRLIGDVARLVELLGHVDDGTGRLRRLDQAEIQVREVVLHLLMTGNLQAARRVAGALGPSLADESRVYIAECPAEARDELVYRCERASGGRAWIVRCPVHTRHVIVLAPAAEDAAGIEAALHACARGAADVVVGGSGTVPLSDLASGYEQAFHALATARGSADRYARFDPRGDLAALLRPRAYGWARAVIEPLAGHWPGRAHDPDGGELTATLRSWLEFSGGAARQLKIHRNTLAARLRLIERLLERSLKDLATQARLYLALRVLAGAPPGPGDQARRLEDLRGDPEIRRWAEAQLAPLLAADRDRYVDTLRAWLAHDARLKPTATALGMSVPGARKRLTRIEEILGRSLLTGPSARYELWFAVEVLGCEFVNDAK